MISKIPRWRHGVTTQALQWWKAKASICYSMSVQETDKQPKWNALLQGAAKAAGLLAVSATDATPPPRTPAQPSLPQDVTLKAVGMAGAGSVIAAGALEMCRFTFRDPGRLGHGSPSPPPPQAHSAR